MALETLLRAIHRAARSPPAHKLGFAVFINKDIASEVADLLLNSRDNHEIAALCIRTLKVCDVRPSPKLTDHDANPNYSLSPPAYTCDHDLHHLIGVLFSSLVQAIMEHSTDGQETVCRCRDRILLVRCCLSVLRGCLLHPLYS
jgi:hypothetical protein